MRRAGREFSIVGGVTYNFENGATNYRNGIDSHVDWAASQFLNEQVHLGLVGEHPLRAVRATAAPAPCSGISSRASTLWVRRRDSSFPMGKAQGYVNSAGVFRIRGQQASRKAGMPG